MPPPGCIEAVCFYLGQNTGYPNKFLFPQSLQANAKITHLIMPWACPLKKCTFLTFQILTAVPWKMQVFCYVTLQYAVWSITVQRPTLLNLDGEGTTVLWNARTMTPLTQHHIHKTWILTFQFTIQQYWYHHLYIMTYCQKVNQTRKKFQKLNWYLKEFIPKQVKQLAVHNNMQCRNVMRYIYISS